MSSDFVIIYQDHDICKHSNGVTHSHDISCSVAEMKNWIEQRISTEKSPGVFL
jgi:hypothetical protein